MVSGIENSLDEIVFHSCESFFSSIIITMKIFIIKELSIVH